MLDIFIEEANKKIPKWEQPVRFTSIGGYKEDYIYYDEYNDVYRAYYKPNKKPNDHLHVQINANIIESKHRIVDRTKKFSKIS